MSRPPDTCDLPRPAALAATFGVACGAWAMATLLWSAGNRAYALSTFMAGLSLGPCLTAYLTAPRGLKQLQRRIVLVTGGLSILALALLADFWLDLEGFFLL